MELVADRSWLFALLAFVAVILVGYLVRAIVLKRIAQLSTRTSTNVDDLLIGGVRRHFPIWSALAGVVIAGRVAPLSDEAIAMLDRVCGAGFSISLVFAAARMVTALVEGSAKTSGTAVGATTLVQHSVRVAIIAIGGLFVLSNLGISITPLLTALGIGSLAVALALQPTLSNLFAGLHLAFARPIRVGDFVEVETGARGYIVDIGWRATRIRDLPNNIIVIPNSRIVEMILKNYSMPEPEQSAIVGIGVAYGSDMAKVERVTIAVARETLAEVEGGVHTFEPFIRYNTFADSAILFSVILRVNQFVDQYLVTHEFMKRLKTRYDREGIEIPFPQRVVHGRMISVSEGPE